MLLSAIPDHHFYHIQSHCLDSGWRYATGFVYTRNPLYGAKFHMLIRYILGRGNENLVIKLLWSMTIPAPVERLAKWDAVCGWSGYEEWESRLSQFLEFKDHFRLWGYDEDRVRIITRLNSKEEFPGPADWEYDQLEEYNKMEGKIFEIEPFTKEFVWEEVWESARISYGLMWDPEEGHFRFIQADELKRNDECLSARCKKVEDEVSAVQIPIR